jgi:hypothetical protein
MEFSELFFILFSLKIMCFSAIASFGAGIVLAVIGVATIKKATHPSQIIFAGIPLIFCVQQITEGFLWLALANPGNSSLQQFTTYTFLSFAQIGLATLCSIGNFITRKERGAKGNIKNISGNRCYCIIIPGFLFNVVPR